MHKKRASMSKIWPVPRKGNKFVVVPSHGGKKEIPLLILMRDVLNHVKTRKELKKILIEKKVLINNKVVKKDNYSLSLFDNLSLKDINKYYRLTYLENRKIGVEEINEKELGTKIAKVIGKKSLKGNKTQVNLSDGRNIIYKDKISVGDSVLINLENKKIEKIIPVKEGSEILVIKGKHLGQKGKIEKIENEEVIIKTDHTNIKIKLREVISLK